MAELSAREQLFLELMNRARMDPAGEALRYGLADLNAGLPAGTIDASAKQVLAPNAFLTDAAKSHSQWMLDTDIFSHEGINGTDPGVRMTNAGFVFNDSWSWGENIALAGSTGTLDANAAVMTEHRDLFLSAGHRENILDGFFREAGVGALTGQYTPGLPDTNTYNALMTTVDFARSGTKVFVTGVTYNDTDNNDFYSIGEGVAGRTFELLSGATVLGYVVGMAAGGYGIGTTSSGVMELHVIGGGLTADIGASFTLGASNVKIDLTDNGTIESNTSVTLTRGTSNVALLGIEHISATGNALNNVIVGNPGNNLLNGDAGLDTAVFNGAKAGYSVVKSGANWVVTDTNLADGNDGTDTLSNIEFLQFSDGTRKLGSVASDFNGDGKSDLVWRNVSTGADAIWLPATAPPTKRRHHCRPQLEDRRCRRLQR